MAAEDFGTIVQIGDILVSEDVVCEYFACDYPVCKGACCIIGDSGAPLDETELEPLEAAYPHFCQLMTQSGRTAAEASGFFELDRDGDYVTPCVRVTGECAYCHFERAQDGDNCLCAIEMAGQTKPASCSLYPIRITKLTGGGLALNLHRWSICKDAYLKGEREGIRVYQFLRGPLERYFGKEFYEALDAAARHIISSRQ